MDQWQLSFDIPNGCYKIMKAKEKKHLGAILMKNGNNFVMFIDDYDLPLFPLPSTDYVLQPLNCKELTLIVIEDEE